MFRSLESRRGPRAAQSLFRVCFGLLTGLGILNSVPIHAQCLIPYWSQTSSSPRTADFLTAPDLDADGKADIAGNTATEAFVMRNDGTGHFAAPSTVYSGTIRGGVVAGDFDGDGKMDLAFAGATSLFVLPGHGDATFGAAIESPIMLAPAALTAGYFDAGASLDLVTFDPAANVLAVFSNDGSGHFTEKSRTPIPANAQALVAADFDADGNIDVVIGHNTSQLYEAFYGRGNGTFENPVTMWGAYQPGFLRADKLTGSGLMDLIVARDSSVVTIRNLGSRNFGDPLAYNTYGTILDVASADFTGDAVPDLLGVTGCDFFTATSTGIGTISYIRDNVSSCYSYYGAVKGATATADFDGDGRLDAAVAFLQYASQQFNSGAPVVNIYKNVCGDSSFTLTTESPTISTGQSATLNIVLDAPVANQYVYFGTTGHFSVTEGAQVLGTTSFQLGRGSIAAPGLSLGDHTLTASYDGDKQYRAVTSAPLVIHVTAATTTTTIAVDPSAGIYAAPYQIKATVTSSTGDNPGGTIRFVIDGQPYNSSPPLVAPQAVAYGPTTVGSHTFQANYLGDATHPPSSASQTYDIAKQTPKFTLSPASVTAGVPFSASIYIFPTYSYGAGPTGSVTLSEGTTSFGTRTLPGYSVANFSIPALTAGRHEFRVVYTGDSNYTALDTFATILAFAGSAAAIDARGNATSIVVSWRPSDYLYISRKTPTQAWGSATRSCCPQNPYVDTNGVQPETVYLHRLETYEGQPLSNVDVAMRISFTDDPLMPGTIIQSVHFKEIVRAANLLRTAASLPALDSAPFNAGATLTAASLTTLRTGINEARVALGAYPFTFTGTIAPGMVIEAATVRDLREAVR